MPRLAACLAAVGVLVALGLPATSAAHQIVTISSGELVIQGDVTKPTDEVTVTYDSVKDEYVIGHDIEDPIPPGCYRDAVEPFHKLHCPARGIVKITVNLGGSRDRFKEDNLSLGYNLQAVYVPVDLRTLVVNAGPGNDIFEEEELNEAELAEQRMAVEEEEGEESRNPVMRDIEMGGDIDSVTLHRGTNVVDFEGGARFAGLGGANTVTIGGGPSSLTLGGGTNQIAVGPGNSKATASDGINTVSFGPGASTFTATGGTNTVLFGTGNSVFSGGAGVDAVTFGPGNNVFSGGKGSDFANLGKGNDSASAGPGKDTVRGGPGKDTIRGGPGGDHLFGGPAFDSIFGGPGRDFCFPGGRGFEASCEVP
jgi:Ca2+-binding RTX toxin-like protein